MSFMRYVPPMGIYETLYAFRDAFGAYMGDPGTHPWSQGFPRTERLPGGPEIPTSVEVPPDLLRYPKAWGMPALREAVAAYYRRWYGVEITSDNVMIFAGGRPAIIATILFLEPGITVRIAETEYTPYYDILERLGRSYSLVPSGVDNGFAPSVEDYLSLPPDYGHAVHEAGGRSGALTRAGEQPRVASGAHAHVPDDDAGQVREGEGGMGHGAGDAGQAPIDGMVRRLLLMSNPCNPTGITRHGDDLAAFVAAARRDPGIGILFDEAYELFHQPPVSALQYVRDIDATNIFVIGAATKGLQSPGIRIGWVIASKRHVEILGNFSSFGMGGVSHPSQCFAMALFEESRIAMARRAVPEFYASQRGRYGEAFARLGLDLFSGDGGFYHWCRLPDGMTAADLNRRLFPTGAAILKGTDCDMARRGEASPLRRFFRFSFGPLAPESFEGDIEILKGALGG